MAEEQFSEPTEQPTPKRLKDAREKGQVARSKELNTMAVTMSAAIGIYLFGVALVDGVAVIMRGGLHIPRDNAVAADQLIEPLAIATASAFTVLAPWFVLLSVVALLASVALGGWSFSGQAMQFKGERINPIAGMKRLFAWRGLMELVKAVVKFLLVGGVAILVLSQLSTDFIQLGRQSLHLALGHAGWLMSVAFLFFSSALILIALVDVPFQIWDHAKKLRMTKHDVKEESKETEGRPEVRSRVRALQQEVANRRMMEDIPIASVVVTNPTHVAVALRYDADEMDTPRVVAKGADLVAARIREAAELHGVPIFEAPPLARALFEGTALARTFHDRLYVGVAQVLTYIYQLDHFMSEGGTEPTPPDIEMPDADEG